MNPRLLIWFGLFFSTVIYLGLAIMMAPETGAFDAAVNSQTVKVLYGLALLAFLFAWFIVPRFVRGAAQLRMVTAMAMFEAAAIFGLVAAFLMKDWRLYLAPWALTVIGFIREFPRTPEDRAPA